jgi:hypothetical protein
MMNECNGAGVDRFCQIGDTCEFEKCSRDIPHIASNSKRHIDFPDDNYSHSSGVYSMTSLLASIAALPLNTDQEFFSFSYYPDILIYDKYNYLDLPGLLDNFDGFSNINDYVHDSFSNNHRLLIVPSGEFMGDENSEIIKQALEYFVESGGTLLVLSQQYDTHIENLVPVPDGEPLNFYGWRQDQSCYYSSVYFKGMHPVVSSSSGELLSGAVDGYFDAWPSTSTVLLNRTKNREAALLYYPYGNGTVILTSLYTDWGYAHSQATLAELRVVRDLITFAKNPNLSIPMYDLNENFNPSISLNVTIKNSAETPVSKAILKAYTPDRNRVLHTIEQAVSLAPGEKVETPVQFTLPGITGTEYGIAQGNYPVPAHLGKAFFITEKKDSTQKIEQKSCIMQQKCLKYKIKLEVA